MTNSQETRSQETPSQEARSERAKDAPSPEAEPQETPAASAGESADPVREDPRPGRPALWVLGLAAALSLGGVVYSLYRVLGMAEGLDDTGVMLLANNLFSPIIVTAFAGAVGGAIAPRLIRGPQRAVAALGFTVVGLVAAVVAYLSFSVDADIALALALVLFGSALVGGLFALPRRSVTVVAGLSATLLLLLSMYARGVLQRTSTVSLFSDPLDEYGALGSAVPFITGLACGLCAFLYLRRKKAGVKLLGHLLAGAIPGAIWLVSTVLAQIGVEAVLNIGLQEVSALDTAFLALSFQWQYNGSMTAMFAGAFCAVLAYGLLMPKVPKAPKAKAAKSS